MIMELTEGTHTGICQVMILQVLLSLSAVTLLKIFALHLWNVVACVDNLFQPLTKVALTEFNPQIEKYPLLKDNCKNLSPLL
jgi:hypothetical protein